MAKFKETEEQPCDLCEDPNYKGIYDDYSQDYFCSQCGAVIYSEWTIGELGWDDYGE